MPFILRNVRLQGVDSVMVPTAERDAVWQRLAQLLPESYYQQAATEITLEQAPAYAGHFLSNKYSWSGRWSISVSNPLLPRPCGAVFREGIKAYHFRPHAGL